jgi:hypothetical protein
MWAGVRMRWDARLEAACVVGAADAATVGL